jgi:hypothetical protein
MSASAIAALLALLTVLITEILKQKAKNLRCDIWNARNDVYQQALKEAGSRPGDASMFHPGPKPDDCECKSAK